MRIKDLFAIVCTVLALVLSCKKDETPATIPVSGISLDVTALELTPGEARSLIATVVPSNATNRNVNWSSSNPSIAVVEQDGKVTAITTGTTTIIAATEDGGKTATCAVTVKSKVSVVYIPDKVFKEYCVKNFDKDGDGEISYSEAEKIIEITVNTDNIYSLEGIESFANLKNLNCCGTFNWIDGVAVFNGKLSNIDVSHNKALTGLQCCWNKLAKLDVSKNVLLRYLDCHANALTSLDITNNTALTGLNCQENSLRTLDISKNVLLESLLCCKSNLTSLDVSNNVNLTFIQCYDNQLTNLDVSKNPALTNLHCSENLLTILDVSKNNALTNLDCSQNPNLAEIWLKTGQTITDFRYDTAVATIKYKTDGN